MEELVQYIQIAFGPGSSPEMKTQASAGLAAFLKKPESFNFFQSLMMTPRNDPLFIEKVNYGAMILQKKLMYNYSNIPKELLPQIKEFVFAKIVEFKNEKLLVKQISLSIVAFALQDITWNNFVLGILEKIPVSQENNSLLLTLFTEVAIAGEKMDLIDTSMRAKFAEVINQTAPSIFDFVVNVCSQNVALTPIAGACVVEWINSTNLSLEVFQKSTLIGFFLKQLGSPYSDISSSVIEAFLKKLTEKNSRLPNDQEKAIIMNLAIGVMQEFVKYTPMITQNPLPCFFQISELFAMDLLQYVKSQYAPLINEHLNQLVLAADTVDEDVVRSVSDASIALLQAPSTRRAKESALLYEFLTDFARKMFQKVVTIHLDTRGLNGEELVDFLVLRKNVPYVVLRRCVDTLSNIASIDILIQLWGVNTNKEPIIAALDACSEDLVMSPGTSRLIQLFSVGIQYVAQQPEIPVLFTRSLIIAIGKYARFFGEECPQVVPDCVEFLMKYVGHPILGKKVAGALMRLSHGCPVCMASKVGVLKTVYDSVVQSVVQGKLKGNEKQFSKLINTFCNVIGSDSTHELLQQVFTVPANVVRKSVIAKSVNNETMTGLWLMGVIFSGLNRSKFRMEIAAVILELQVPEVLHGLLELLVNIKNEGGIDECCDVIGGMYLVIQAHAQPFLINSLQIIGKGYSFTKSASFILCLSKIIDAVYSTQMLRDTLLKNSVPILDQAMKSANSVSNDLIEYIAACFGTMTIPKEIFEGVFKWHVTMLITPEQRAYHALCINLVRIINNKEVTAAVVQPEVLLSCLESVVHLYTKEREKECSLVLRELYAIDSVSFCNNMQLIFQNKYTTVPNGFRQSFMPNNRLPKSAFNKLIEDLFFILKETA
ncbi:hypothetical protein EIN_253220 [Entamoeba invadens IP1]|uniref:Exportin-1/Importin-beta-like domain-containing protein n=1 Tax=Entamoeba invadens IP1 TaxID=370355 RepID=A0A0A1UF05_ENTIV|nr:hypothetical protein EIN_253220 [Entamoeba invadens IP1]ELP95058.1 hypothetical protein EIN_253220 [Entamoeba invadens IP1]|eukprot:XP_004261829.1 hypothetical protein EIN_253220 [Entamoeba invadens IP1]